MTVDIPSGFCQLAIYSDSSVVKNGRAVTLLGFHMGTSDLATITTAAVAAWEDRMVGLQSTEFTFAGVKGVTATDTFEQSAAAGGDRAGALAPPNTAYLLKKITALRGRHGRGRSYLPGFLLAADIADDGSIHPIPNANVLAGFADFGGDMLAAGYTGVILHRTGSSLAPTEITGVTSETKVATQRRRLR